MRTHEFLRDFQIHIDPAYDMENFIVEHGLWEPHIVAAIQYFVTAGSVCADIGANAGYHTLAMVQRGGIVYAFEPDSETYSRLLANLQLNPSIMDQVKPYKVGLSDRADTLTVFKSGDANHRGNSYLGVTADPNKWTNYEIQNNEKCVVTTLDEALPPDARLDFLKIDVEGMELEVLRGSTRLITANRPTIVYESLMNNFCTEKIRQVEELLRTLGYHFFYIDLKSYLLKPTSYPDLQYDTVAIHNSMLPKYVEYMDFKVT